MASSKGRYSTSPTRPLPLWDDALSALINLGYSRALAEQALRQVHTHDKPLTLEDILRLSLSRLAAT